MNKFTLALIVVFFVNFVHSQEREANDFEISGMVGYSAADFYGENASFFGNLSGINIGAHADFYLSDRWSIRSGAFYQTMGAKIDRAKEKLTYLTVPVNMNWHFGGNRGWNLNFGPSFGFLLDSKSVFNNQISGTTLPVNTFQLGLSLGLGYKFKVSDNLSLMIDYQETAGITKVYDDVVLDLRNSYSSFNVGAVFLL
jgi:opacity protein-like surface antigen